MSEGWEFGCAAGSFCACLAAGHDGKGNVMREYDAGFLRCGGKVVRPGLGVLARLKNDEEVARRIKEAGEKLTKAIEKGLK